MMLIRGIVHFASTVFIVRNFQLVTRSCLLVNGDSSGGGDGEELQPGDPQALRLELQVF